MSKTTLQRLSATLAVMLLFFSLMMAQGNLTKKVSPYLINLLNSRQQQVLNAKAVEQQPKARKVTAFVRTTDTSVLTGAGCTVNASFGDDIYIASIPLDSLERLAESACISRIEADRAPRLMNDTMSVIINAKPVYEGQNLPHAFTGKGVVVGIADGDFDLTHPTFYSVDGSQYRVKSYWDTQATSGGSEAPSGGQGRQYTTQEEILAKAHSDGNTDAESHGTHTAGIAAGSGYGSQYRGMAYESDIVLVDAIFSDDTDFDEQSNADAVLCFKYIFDYAASQDMPCVINYSAGVYQSMDDPYELYSKAIENITGPGRILAVSAGNGGNRDIYMKKAANQQRVGTTICGDDVVVPLKLLADGDFQMRFIRHDTVDIAYSDTLIIKSSQLTGEQPTFALNDRGSDDTYTLTFEEFTSPYYPAKQGYSISIKSRQTPVGSISPVSVELMGEGSEIELMTSYYSCEFNHRKDMMADADNSHTLSYPSIFPSVISVGSVAYRTGYMSDYTKEYVDETDGSGGEVAGSSSRGPVVDGRIKPDVVAPGTNIRSSLSSYFVERTKEEAEQGKISQETATERLQIVTDITTFNGRQYPWGAYSGTSMASPAVAGAIALWLEANPKLSPQDCLNIFAKTCKKPVDSLSYPNNSYGYGEIDVYAGLLEALKLSGIPAISKHQPSALSFALAYKQLSIAGAEEGKAFTVRIYTTAGSLVYQQAFSGGTVTIDLSNLPGGILAVQVDGATRQTTGSTLIRL